MKVKIINKSKHKLPEYKTKYSVGMDIRANIEKEIVLKPLERALIPTGIYVEIPEGYEIQIRPRSGMAINHGITILNTPGTIDPDYRGEIKIIVINLSNENVKIADGDRIGQIVLKKYEKIEWQEVEKLNNTERGEGGFGHTGKN